MKMFIFIQKSACVFKQKLQPNLPFKFVRKFSIEGKGAGRSYVLLNLNNPWCALQLHGRQSINLDVRYTKAHTTDTENRSHISSFFSLYTMETPCCSFSYRWSIKEAECIFILSLIITSL